MINLKGIQKWQHIWSGCSDCILASWHGPLTPKQEYRSTSLDGQYDELANLYLAICTYGGRCKKREVRPERSRLSRSCQSQREMISAHSQRGRFPWNIVQIQKNKKRHCHFVPKQQHAVIIRRPSVNVEIITTTALLKKKKKDERTHLEWQGGL